MGECSEGGGGYCPERYCFGVVVFGGIIQGELSGCQKSGGNCLEGKFHRGQLSGGEQLSRGKLFRGNCSGSKSLGGGGGGYGGQLSRGEMSVYR